MLGMQAKRAIILALDRLKVASKDIEAAQNAVVESARSKDVVETYGTYVSDCENCPGWDPLRQLLGTRLSNAIDRIEGAHGRAFVLGAIRKSIAIKHAERGPPLAVRMPANSDACGQAAVQEICRASTLKVLAVVVLP